VRVRESERERERESERENKLEPVGSARTILIEDFLSFKYLDTPAIVPPVPALIINGEGERER
jgi:hypothetical protein